MTPRRALNELRDLLWQMWGNAHGRLQVSEMHLAADVANLPLTEESLNRFVSRSRSKARYEAARSQLNGLLLSLHEAVVDGIDEFEDLGFDWDAEFAGLDDEDLFGVDAFADEDATQVVNAVEAALEEPLEDRNRTVYQNGKRYSGASWSLGQPLSVVLYDKTLQAQLTNRRHMEPIWKANGLEQGERVTRCEVRFGREILHDLHPRVLPPASTTSPEATASVGASPFDDPWYCLEHLQEMWGLAVGQPREDCPDAVNVAWIRQVVPVEGDTNRSRWPTDPSWTILQRAQFSPASEKARRLIRRHQANASVKVLVSLMGGCLVSEVAHAHPNGGQYDISAAIGEIAPALLREFEKPSKDFGELVRERRRRWGKPLPPAEKILPFHSAFARDNTDSTPDVPALEAEPPDNASEHERAKWRVLLAARRLCEAEHAYELALHQRKPRRLLTQLRAEVDMEASAYSAAVERLGK